MNYYRRASPALRGLFLTSTALAGVVAPLTGSDRASAQCIDVAFSVPPNILLTCNPPGVVTTNATNPPTETTPSPLPFESYISNARNQQFDANIEAIISPGAAITGAGLEIRALGTTPHTIVVTNNGSVSTVSLITDWKFRETGGPLLTLGTGAQALRRAATLRDSRFSTRTVATLTLGPHLRRSPVHSRAPLGFFIGVPIGSLDQFNGSATVFMSGGSATATSPNGSAIFLDARSGSGALSITTTNGTVVNTIAGAAGFADGITALSGSGSASLTTDALIGSAAVPFRVGIFARVGSGTGSVTVNQTGGSIFAGSGIFASSAGGSLGVTSNGSINATFGIQTESNSGSITVNAAGGITAEQNAISAQTSAGAISITNTGTLLGGGSLNDPDAGLVRTAAIETVNGTGQTTITNAGTVTGRPEGSSVISATSSGGTIAIVNTADALIHSSTNSPGDLVILTSGGPATISNAGTLTGRLSLGGSSNMLSNTGTWSTSGTSTIGGIFSNQAAATFVTSGTSTIAGLSSLSNAGTFTTAGLTAFTGAFTATNSGTFSANGTTNFAGLSSFANSGTFFANGTTDFGGGNFNNTGTANLANGSATNNATINNQSGGAFFATGSVGFTNVAFSNQAGGTFSTSGTTALTFNSGSTFANAGAFVANGTTSISGLSNFANSGTFNVNGTTNFAGLSSFANSGTFFANGTTDFGGGNFNNTGTVNLANGSTTNNATINNQSGGAFFATGSVGFTNVAFNNQPGGTFSTSETTALTFNGGSTFANAGAFVANGTTSISGLSNFANSGTFNANGTTNFAGLSSFANSGTFFANGTTDFGGGNFNNTGTVNLANGSATNNATINNQSGGAFFATGSVGFTNVAFNNQPGGTFSTSGTTALTFNGASTFRMQGYSPPTARPASVACPILPIPGRSPRTGRRVLPACPALRVPDS